MIVLMVSGCYYFFWWDGGVFEYPNLPGYGFLLSVPRRFSKPRQLISWIRQDQLQHFDECVQRRLQKVATCVAYDKASTRVPSTSQCVT